MAPDNVLESELRLGMFRPDTKLVTVDISPLMASFTSGAPAVEMAWLLSSTTSQVIRYGILYANSKSATYSLITTM
jgi:hypothetical protein